MVSFGSTEVAHKLKHTDVRNIIGDDDALQEGILPVLVEYNLAQFIVADVPGTEHNVRLAWVRHGTII